MGTLTATREEGVETSPSPDVTLRHLRYFLALADELSYRRAADRLFISQPALSTAIKQLEHQFGVKLFTRNTREVSLTDTGAAWVPLVRSALEGVEAAVDALVALGGRESARVRFGYLIGTGADLFFEMLGHLEVAYPELTIEPTEFDFSDPTAGLGDGTSDLALIRPPVDLPGHRMLALARDDWVACLPRDHRLAHREDVRIEELLDDPIVSAPMAAGVWRDYWLAMDVRGDRAPNVVAVAATYEVETTLIARGLGISFTTRATARLYDRPGVVYVPISDRPPSYLALAWNPATLTRESALLLKHAQKHWRLDSVSEAEWAFEN